MARWNNCELHVAVKAKPDGTEAGRVCQVSPAPTESVTLLGMATEPVQLSWRAGQVGSEVMRKA